MRPVLILTLNLVVLVGGTALADNIAADVLEVVDYGTYAPDRQSPTLLSQTDRIPAVVGTVFGIRVRSGADSSALFSYRWLFPEMQNPDTGRVWTEMTGTQELFGDSSYPFLVKINHFWEAVPGDWTIQLLDGERVVIERTFHVYTSLPSDD